MIARDVPFDRVVHKWMDAPPEAWASYKYVRKIVKGDKDAVDKWIEWRVRRHKEDPTAGKIVTKAVRKSGNVRRGVARYLKGKVKTIRSIMANGWRSDKGRITATLREDGMYVINNGYHRIMVMRALKYPSIPEIVICE